MAETSDLRPQDGQQGGPSLSPQLPPVLVASLSTITMMVLTLTGPESVPWYINLVVSVLFGILAFPIARAAPSPWRILCLLGVAIIWVCISHFVFKTIPPWFAEGASTDFCESGLSATKAIVVISLLVLVITSSLAVARLGGDDRDRWAIVVAILAFIAAMFFYLVLNVLMCGVPGLQLRGEPAVPEESGGGIPDTTAEVEEETPTPTPTLTLTPTETATITCTPSPEITPLSTPPTPSECNNDGVCNPSTENSDLCPWDCHCVDDGLCQPGEGAGCRDCSDDPASLCGVPCPYGICEHLACVPLPDGWRCWDPEYCDGNDVPGGGGDGPSSGGSSDDDDDDICIPNGECYCAKSPNPPRNWICTDSCGNSVPYSSSCHRNE